MTKSKFGDVPTNTIIVGLVTKVIGGRLPTVAKRTGMTKEQQAAWWQRTDYAWACGPCDPLVGVTYKTMATAQRAANKHALEHRNCTVREA